MPETRTGWGALRDVVGGVLGLVLLLWLIGAIISGPPLLAYVLIPAALLASAVSSPEVLLTLLLLLVTALVGAAVLAALAAALRAPLELLASRADRSAIAAATAAAQAAAHDAAPPELLLRRRYLAGELTSGAYADAMMALLKERFERGDLTLADYESAVERRARSRPTSLVIT